MAATGYDTDFSILDAITDMDEVPAPTVEISSDPTIVKTTDQLLRAINKGTAITIEAEEIKCLELTLSLQDLRILWQAVKSTKTLKFLDLSGQGHVGDSDFKEALISNTSLLELRLAGCNIDGEICEKLSDVIKNNRTLRSLDLQFNNLAVNGFKHLAAGLKHNDSLTVLNLGDNSFDRESLSYIREALEVNKTVQWLNLDDSSIDRKEWLDVVGMYTDNHRRHKLFVQNTTVLIHNIARSPDLVLGVPAEIWCLVFQSVRLSGVYIDFSKRCRHIFDKYKRSK